MEEIVGNVELQKFDIEIALEQQLGAQPLPFPGMDKSGSAICTFFMHGQCSKAGACPFRHVKGDRSIVCKHWLRGLCKKGDDCEFLHEYDMSKMPECYFFSKFGLCSNKECPFLHIDPEKKIKDCPWYDRGFCRHGPHCKNRHVRRVLCQNYLCGFCPEGPKCKYQHPKFTIPVSDPVVQVKKSTITCHFCGEVGHKALHCPKLPAGGHGEGKLLQVQSMGGAHDSSPKGEFDPARRDQPVKRPLTEVTCYKCGEKGHYANRCPKGHLAFLAATAGPNIREQQQQQDMQQQQGTPMA